MDKYLENTVREVSVATTFLSDTIFNFKMMFHLINLQYSSFYFCNVVVHKPVLYLVFSGKERVDGSVRCSSVNLVWLCLVVEGLEQCQQNPNDKQHWR